MGRAGCVCGGGFLASEVAGSRASRAWRRECCTSSFGLSSIHSTSSSSVPLFLLFLSRCLLFFPPPPPISFPPLLPFITSSDLSLPLLFRPLSPPCPPPMISPYSPSYSFITSFISYSFSTSSSTNSKSKEQSCLLLPWEHLSLVAAFSWLSAGLGPAREDWWSGSSISFVSSSQRPWNPPASSKAPISCPWKGWGQEGEGLSRAQGQAWEWDWAAVTFTNTTTPPSSLLNTFRYNTANNDKKKKKNTTKTKTLLPAPNCAQKSP